MPSAEKVNSTQQSFGSVKIFSIPLDTPWAVSPVNAKQIPLNTLDYVPDPDEIDEENCSLENREEVFIDV